MVKFPMRSLFFNCCLVMLLFVEHIRGYSRVAFGRYSWVQRTTGAIEQIRAVGAIEKATVSPWRLRAVIELHDNPDEDEDLSHLTSEFHRLAGEGDSGGVSFSSFLRSEEVQAIITDDGTFLQDIAEIWMKYAGSDTNPVNLESFIAINREIDDLFEFVDEDYDDDDEDNDGMINSETSMIMDEIDEEGACVAIG